MDLQHTNDVADYIAASENPELLGPAWDLIQRTVAARFGQPARGFHDGAQVQMISDGGTPYGLDAWEFLCELFQDAATFHEIQVRDAFADSAD